MYTNVNFQSLAALKRALKEGQEITVYSPGPFPCPKDGQVDLEGPHYPQPHKWYGAGVVKDGRLISVK